MAAAAPTPTLLRSSIARERVAWFVHKERLRGGAFLPPKAAPQPTFLHGFLLPFSLIVATLRHPTLGMAYLKILVVRALVVALLSTIVFNLPGVGPGTEDEKAKAAAIDKDEEAKAKIEEAKAKDEEAKAKQEEAAAILAEKAKLLGLAAPATEAPANAGADAGTNAAPAPASTSAADAGAPLHVTAPGVTVDVDPAKREKKLSLFGNSIRFTKAPPGTPPRPSFSMDVHPDRHAESFFKPILDGWSWLAWFVAVMSATEGFLAFFSRRWDDWLGFHASAIAKVRPESSWPTTPKVALDLRYLFRKVKRRARGYIVFGSGVPLFFLFQVIPLVGKPLFAVGLTLWSWYWLAVFSAAKSAHAWADDGAAPSPLLVRELRDRSAELRVLKPIHLYARLWARILRSINAAASTFERSPAPFLGLALARIILSLPGLYLLARPIVPVAASRLIAESDPLDRFSAR